MSKEREILKSGLWYTIGSFFVKAMAFIALPLFTKIMTTEEYGVFGTYQAYETILSVVICLGITGTIRPAYKEFKDKFDDYVTSITFPIFLISLVLSIIVGLYAFITKDTYYSFFAIALVLNCLGNALREIISSRLIIKNKYKLNLLISFFVSVLNICISYFLCIYTFSGAKHFGRIWGTVISALFVGVLFFILQLRNSKKIIWPMAWKFSIIIGIPLVFHQLSISLLGQCDKIMISHFIGDSAAGIYTSMITIILVPQAIMIALENSWAPWFYNNYENGLSAEKRKEFQKLNEKLIWLFVIVIIGFQLLCKEVVLLMTDKAYHDGVNVLYVLSISVFSNFLYIFSVNIEYYHKKTKYISLFTIIAAVLNVGFNYLGIILFGYIGAALATLASRLVLLSLHYIYSKKLSGFNSIRLKNVLLSLSIVGVMSILTYFLSDSMIIRLILAFLTALIGIVYIYWFFIKENSKKDGDCIE